MALLKIFFIRRIYRDVTSPFRTGLSPGRIPVPRGAQHHSATAAGIAGHTPGSSFSGSGRAGYLQSSHGPGCGPGGKLSVPAALEGVGAAAADGGTGVNGGRPAGGSEQDTR